MAILIPDGHPTLAIKRAAFERVGLTRQDLDEWLGLTDQEFRVEGDLIVVGPIFDTSAFEELLGEFDERGLEHFEDYFELSGNWPEWLQVYVSTRRSTVS